MRHLTETCPALDAVSEWRAAGAALDAIGRGDNSESDWDASERFRCAFSRLRELTDPMRGPVSRGGAVAALELAADPEAEALDIDDYRALALIALRYLRG